SSKGIIDGLVNRLLPERLSERKLMMLTGLFAFIFSSMADNITSTLVCITVLVSLKLPTEKLLRYIVLVIFSVNAGGAALITGDVTTLMIFLAGKVAILDLALLVLPALIAVLLLAWMLSRPLTDDLVLQKQEFNITRGDKVIAYMFFFTILGTIVANIAFSIPPVLSFLFGLSLMFMVVQFMNKDEPILDYVRRIEFDTLLFFLGVLLLVGMLKELGVLAYFPKLYNYLPTLAANYVVGLVSALFDNVPLTAALLKSGIDMSLSEWLTLTYSVGVGGSLLVIGSAAGVVAMSKVEALTFGSYLKFSGYLLVAYTVGFVGVVTLGQILSQ
ncbi:sodium:proton antiporter NhaD, partial [Ketobacter sp.]